MSKEINISVANSIVQSGGDDFPYSEFQCNCAEPEANLEISDGHDAKKSLLIVGAGQIIFINNALWN